MGKYVDHTDAYKSLNEALDHAGLIHTNTRVNIVKIDSEDTIETDGIGLPEKQARCDPGARRFW